MFETSIGDISITKAALNTGASFVEKCFCPEGYDGTSCENCKANYYRERDGTCKPCPCNGA